MTVAVPLHLLNALDDTRLSWLAPGFVADKATALIRSLPKALRRNFVPAPDFGRAFAEAHPQPEADSLEGALGHFLKRLSGVEVSALDFDLAGIEPHLRANLRLLDSDGQRVLAESRDLLELRERFGQRAAEAFARHAAQGMARAGLTEFPGQPVPVSVPGEGRAAYRRCRRWRLRRPSPSRATRVAERLHPQGVRRLMASAWPTG